MTRPTLVRHHIHAARTMRREAARFARWGDAAQADKLRRAARLALDAAHAARALPL